MDPDALKEAASRGTPTPGQQVAHFLKTETFYLVLVVMVVAMATPVIVGSFHDAGVVLGLRAEQPGATGTSPGPAPLLRKDLQAAEGDWMKAAARSDPRAVEFATGVRRLNDLLRWCGWAALLALAVWQALPDSGQVRPAAPAPVWGLWDVAKLAALFAIGSQVFHYIFPFNPVRPFADRGDWMAEIFARILLVGALVHIVVSERGGRLRDLGIRGNFVGNILIGLVAFLAVQPFLHLAGALEDRWYPNGTVQETLLAMLRTRSAGALWLAAGMAVIASPIAEELFFRSFLQPALQQSLGRWMGILASTAFFAVAHMDLYAVPPLLVLGFALGYAYDRTRSLAVPVIVHAAYNGMTVLSLFADRGLADAASRALR